VVREIGPPFIAEEEEAEEEEAEEEEAEEEEEEEEMGDGNTVTPAGADVGTTDVVITLWVVIVTFEDSMSLFSRNACAFSLLTRPLSAL